MTRSKQLRSMLLLLMGVATAMLLAVPLSAEPPPAQGVRITPIGKPIWKPVDFHLFVAPIGTGDDGFAEFGTNAQALLPPPNHLPTTTSLAPVGPGRPHAPPYDSELADGVANLGFHEGVHFRSSEFTGGNGVWLVWMNVPMPGVVGSSPDSPFHPRIIPNSLFPILVRGISYHNNKVFDPFLAVGAVPPLDGNVGFAGLDGHSHFPIFNADSVEFDINQPPEKLNGSYEYQYTMIDQSGKGNGWAISAHFTIAP